jgi:hypothetical protein
MDKYAEIIKLNLKNYNDTLKELSTLVKKIGGDGTIHGCIVDIDFWRHIYLHPQDGTITSYSSPEFGYRTEYSTVGELLFKETPQLYANYQKLLSGSTNDEDVFNNTEEEKQGFYDTTLYKASKLIKGLQYVTENNIIRVWNDDVITNFEQYISGEKSFLDNENLLIDH